MGKIKNIKFLFLFSFLFFGCQSFDKTAEICDDGIDNDANGYYDCVDSACADDPACQFTNTNNTNNQDIETNCDDGIDNDGDGFIDCDDPDCDNDSHCYEVDCNDGIDNDDDGKIDCDDDDCINLDNMCGEECGNDIDDDNDGFADCYDSECFFHNSCGVKERDCDNDFDDDGDGNIDCDDSDCTNQCAEICDDTFDNDADGLIDCADPECFDDSKCDPTSEICDDGIDNNHNGEIDCADETCGYTSHCTCNMENIFWNMQGGLEECNQPYECSYQYNNDETEDHAVCVSMDSVNKEYYEQCGGAEECPKGSICTSNIGHSTDNYTCVPLCQKETHPNCPDNGVCIGYYLYDDLNTCVPPGNCDLVNQNCDQDDACYIISMDGSNYFTACYREGNTSSWNHCIPGNFECKAGSQCLLTHLGNRCAPLCMAGTDCNAGQMCHHVENYEFGYCF